MEKVIMFCLKSSATKSSAISQLAAFYVSSSVCIRQ